MCRIPLWPPWFCSSSVLSKCVSGCVSVCTIHRETDLNDLNFSQLAKIDTDGTLQSSAWAVLVWLRHICFVSTLLLACFNVSLCRSLCCLACQVLSRWEFFEASCAIRVSGMNVYLHCHQGARVLIDWNKSGAAEFLLEPSFAFYIFTAEVWRMRLTLCWTRSCFQHSPCWTGEPV